MKIEILISTIDAGIGKIPLVLLPPEKDLAYCISHQVTERRYLTLPEELRRPDVKVDQIAGRGLCRNRNNTLAMASGDVALLADDDVRYRPAYLKALRDAFAADQDMAVACFKIDTPPGDPEYKEYSENSYLLNKESCHYISTLEIAFRTELIKERAIFFDERFGLGSRLNSFGEEAVFIHDCIKAGLKVKFVPRYVVEHPAVSTIKGLKRFDTVNTVFKGAYDARRYGWKACPAAFYDLVRYRSELAGEGKSGKAYMKERLQGAWYILRSGKTALVEPRRAAFDLEDSG